MRTATTNAERALDPKVLAVFLAAAGPDVQLLDITDAPSHVRLPRSMPVPTVYAYRQAGEKWICQPLQLAELVDNPGKAGAAMRKALREGL